MQKIIKQKEKVKLTRDDKDRIGIGFSAIVKNTVLLGEDGLYYNKVNKKDIRKLI